MLGLGSVETMEAVFVPFTPRGRLCVAVQVHVNTQELVALPAGLKEKVARHKHREQAQPAACA